MERICVDFDWVSRMNSKSPLFIVGMPRSGTKLLRTLINQHPRVAILGVETEFLPLWKKRWDSFGPLSRWENFERFYNWTKRLSYFYLYNEEVGPIIEARAWHQSCAGEFDIASVFAALARHDLSLTNDASVIWGDKSPSYIRHIALLNDLYPEARFIHIVRDVRDYALSLNKSFGKDMLRASQRWADDVLLAHQQGKKIGERYAEVRYEDLLADPDKEMRRLCKFLEIAFSTELTTLQTPAERDFEHQRGIGTGRTEIVSDNTEKWRQVMPPSLLGKIESIACETLQQLGYEVNQHVTPCKLSALSMALRQLTDGANLLRSNSRFGLIEAVKFYGRAYWTGAPSHITRD